MYSSQTPIDIHCSKLVDWLVLRRHCKKDWGQDLALIRRKIRSALLDMPENEEIKQLLIGSKLDYFKSKRIVDILKLTEASSKNIFGFYSSQRMKDWQEIVSAYERDYIYLAELATDLIRDTNYEVPGIRKVITKLSKEKDEAEKEQSNLMRKAQQFNSEHQKLAQSYGIKGSNIRTELEEQLKSLNDIMNEVVNLSKHLGPAVEFYQEFSKLTSLQDSSLLVPMIKHILNKGNTIVFEWKYGEKAHTIINCDKATSTASNPSEIDLVDDEIDFGDDLPSSDSSSGFVHVENTEVTQIKLDEAYIKMESDNKEEKASSTETRQSFNPEEKIALGDEAKLVLEYRKTRNAFVNNLHELEAFFVQIIENLKENDNKSNQSFLSEGNSKLQRFNDEELSNLLGIIRQIISIFSQEKNRILFQINDSPSYLESIREKFAQKQKQSSECTIKADLLNDQIKEFERQRRETEIHLKKCIANAKELQKKVETSLGDIYKGRAINIMGCVS